MLMHIPPEQHRRESQLQPLLRVRLTLLEVDLCPSRVDLPEILFALERRRESVSGWFGAFVESGPFRASLFGEGGFADDVCRVVEGEGGVSLR